MAAYGDTTYYFFETENLPLYGPLRSIGVPEPLIDIVEPLSIFVVELGYRRDIPPYVPSPARLIPVQTRSKSSTTSSRRSTRRSTTRSPSSVPLRH